MCSVSISNYCTSNSKVDTFVIMFTILIIFVLIAYMCNCETVVTIPDKVASCSVVEATEMVIVSPPVPLTTSTLFDFSTVTRPECITEFFYNYIYKALS
jgi:hypothetical protein